LLLKIDTAMEYNPRQRKYNGMANITLTVQMICGIRHAEDEDMYVSVCPRLGVYSQGETEAEALEAIKSAVGLHLATAFDHNRLDKVLRKAGFQKMSDGAATPLADPQTDEFVKVHIHGAFKEFPIEVPLTLLASRSQTDYACAR
jgi:predicted RNase H-like HicB family nuclease